MKIVFASHSAQVGVFRVGSHHLSRELSRLGHDVSHVSSVVTPAHLLKIRTPDVRKRFKIALSGPIRDEDGVSHSVPLLVMPPGPFGDSTQSRLMKHPIRSWRTLVGSAGSIDVLVIDQPALVDLIDTLRPKVVIYRPTDAHFDDRLRRAEIRVLKRADGLVATSEVVRDEVSKHMRTLPPNLVLENGVEYERFSSPTEPGARNGVVYLGALDRRFDWETLGVMAASHPSVPFHIAGPLPNRVPIDVPDNVRLLGAVPYVDAPKLLASARVGLLPFSDDPGNQGRSPMKYYEYLAAGLSVVGSSSPTLLSRSAPSVWLYSSSTEAVNALSAALAADSPNTAGQTYAEGFSWSARARELEEFLSSVGGRP
jgi:teichuronic acid biosynthesis glycosyltransferase TuaH